MEHRQARILGGVLNDQPSVEERRQLLMEAHALMQRAVGSDSAEAIAHSPQRFVEWQEDVFVTAHEQYSREDVRLFPDNDYSSLDLILMKVNAVSACEHHYAPAILKASVGYVPNELTLGYSKIGKMFKHFASRYTMDERIVTSFLREFDEVVHPKGVAILVRGWHTCVIGRGGSERDPVVLLGSNGMLRESRAEMSNFLSLSSETATPFH